MPKYFSSQPIVLTTSSAQNLYNGLAVGFKNNIDYIHSSESISPEIDQFISSAVSEFNTHLHATRDTLERLNDGRACYLEQNNLKLLEIKTDPLITTVSCSSREEMDFLEFLYLFDSIVLSVETIHFYHPHAMDAKSKTSQIKNIVRQFRFLNGELRTYRDKLKEMSSKHIDSRKLSPQQRMLRKTPPANPVSIPNV